MTFNPLHLGLASCRPAHAQSVELDALLVLSPARVWVFAMALRQLSTYVPFLRSFLSAEEEQGGEEEKEEAASLAPARVAVVGAGIGGSLAAYFLRQRGGEAVEVDVFERAAVGGRTGVFTFQGHTYETGASIIHTSNKYLVDLAKEFGEQIVVSLEIHRFRREREERTYQTLGIATGSGTS